MGTSLMEDSLIQWVHRHVDIIKYAGIAFGILYSCYRRLLTDRRTDQREVQKDEYVETLTEHLLEAQKREDVARDEMIRQTADYQRTIIDNETLKKTIVDLHDTISQLQTQLKANSRNSYTSDPSSGDDNGKR